MPVSKNPHYLIHVEHPCSLFIKLTQNERISQVAGAQAIMYCIAKNEDERITNVKSGDFLYSSLPPINSISITNELILDSDYSYPFNLTIMVATLEAKKGTFMLKVWCTDQDFDLTPM